MMLMQINNHKSAIKCFCKIQKMITATEEHSNLKAKCAACRGLLIKLQLSVKSE